MKKIILGKLPPRGESTLEKFPPIKLPPGKLPPTENYFRQNSHLEYSHHFVSYLL